MVYQTLVTTIHSPVSTQNTQVCRADDRRRWENLPGTIVCLNSYILVSDFASRLSLAPTLPSLFSLFKVTDNLMLWNLILAVTIDFYGMGTFLYVYSRLDSINKLTN